jgi:CRISPR-associated protein Cmr1
MSEEQEGRVLAPVVNRAALAGMAGDARKAYAALRPGGKPPPRRTATGEDACEITVRLKVVTPILGGGPRLRNVDGVDIIRVPTVRGHLRFWWRALYGHLYESAEELYKAESALWGRPADDKGGRSEVEVRVDVVSKPEPDTSRVSIGTVDGYALWPAREPHADRRPPGTQFTLTIIGPLQHETVLRNSLCAWLLFGGYGSRTRRGLGSLTVTAANQKEEGGQRKMWLPDIKVDDDPKEVRKKISACFGSDRDIFLPGEEATQESNTLPRLAGAALLLPLPDPNNRNIEHVGDRSAMNAWTESLGWLRSFRQGIAGAGAREEGAAGAPGVSNWPEADKIRHFTRNRNGHPPRHNHEPAFPRAGFGMPIVMKFKRGDRDPDGQFEILWRSGQKVHERLASPLILKALPLANGRFLPMALWLDRNNLPGSKVYVKEYENSAADFDVLAAAGEEARYSGALAKAFRPHPRLPAKSSLRGFFITYLEGKGCRRIAI